MMLLPKGEAEQFHFVKRGSMKEGKFVPLCYMEAKLEVKSNLLLGPVHWKAITVVGKD